MNRILEKKIAVFFFKKYNFYALLPNFHNLPTRSRSNRQNRNAPSAASYVAFHELNERA